MRFLKSWLTRRRVEREVRKAFAAAPASPTSGFEPCAFYDEGVDRIVVLTEDCSILEVPAPGQRLILLENTHSLNGCVGFAIESASRFCTSHKLLRNGAVDLGRALDRVLDESPACEAQVAIARRVLTRHWLASVTMPEMAHA